MESDKAQSASTLFETNFPCQPRVSTALFGKAASSQRPVSSAETGFTVIDRSNIHKKAEILFIEHFINEIIIGPLRIMK